MFILNITILAFQLINLGMLEFPYRLKLGKMITNTVRYSEESVATS